VETGVPGETLDRRKPLTIVIGYTSPAGEGLVHKY